MTAELDVVGAACAAIEELLRNNPDSFYYAEKITTAPDGGVRITYKIDKIKVEVTRRAAHGVLYNVGRDDE